MAKRDSNGRFVKGSTTAKKQPAKAQASGKRTYEKEKFTLTYFEPFAEDETFEVALSSEELEVFKQRMKIQFAAKYGVNLSQVHIQ